MGHGDEIQANCRLLIKTTQGMLNVTLTYDKASVEWLDAYIERNRRELNKQGSIDGLVVLMGSFLGECIRRQFGGHWEEIDGQMAIRFTKVKGLTSAFPFNKVRKQFIGGHERGESIAGFYQAIPVLQARKL